MTKFNEPPDSAEQRQSDANLLRLAHNAKDPASIQQLHERYDQLLQGFFKNLVDSKPFMIGEPDRLEDYSKTTVASLLAKCWQHVSDHAAQFDTNKSNLLQFIASEAIATSRDYLRELGLKDTETFFCSQTEWARDHQQNERALWADPSKFKEEYSGYIVKCCWEFLSMQKSLDGKDSAKLAGCSTLGQTVLRAAQRKRFAPPDQKITDWLDTTMHRTFDMFDRNQQRETFLAAYSPPTPVNSHPPMEQRALGPISVWVNFIIQDYQKSAVRPLIESAVSVCSKAVAAISSALNRQRR